MNAILGFSELLEKDAAEQFSAKQRRWIQHIRNAGQHLLQLINDILDLSKIEAGQMEIRSEDFRVAAALPEVLSIITPSAMAKNIQIAIDVPENLHIRADRVRFKQIVYNLLSNAVKFTPEGGAIRVECVRQGDTALMSVVDNGVGIRPEDQGIIFEDFRQVKTTAGNVKEGTGLGLSIVRRLVRMQGGQIRVESEFGKGSRFTFSLPASKKPLPDTVPAAPASLPPERSRPLVLAVDDEPEALELLKNFLQDGNYDVLTASSASEAVSLAREHQPDVITLDILMPGGTGWEVLHTLKNNPKTATVPIIVVSVVDRKELGFILGASDYLVKPVSKDELIQAIRQHSGRLARGSPILVVDDEPEDLRNMMAAVEEAGYTPILAKNGLEAVRHVERIRPRAVVLDLVMPEMDGFETLQRMRANPALAEVPILVLTARNLSQAESELLLRNANSWFRKGPGWKDELLERIRGAVGDGRTNPVGAA
jgi:CheY-like chemotaxis protein/two-component sensor histidine kinase